MPKLPMDYSKCIMYRIVCKDINIPDCYVGHTTNLSKRKTQHKWMSKTSNRYVYEFIRNNGDFDNWNVIEIEKYPCNDKREAESREEYWFNLLRPNMNSNKAFTGIITETIEEYRKQYNKNKYVCECGSICRNTDKSRHFKTIKHQQFVSQQETLIHDGSTIALK